MGPEGIGPDPLRDPSAPVRKKRGCFATGCLTTLGLLLIGTVVVGGLLLRVPQQLGILPSGARLLQGTPDRAAAAAILDQVAAAGVDTTGLSLYVFPVEGQDGTLAYAVLDTSAGFHFRPARTPTPCPTCSASWPPGSAVDEAHIEQVAIAYRDESGRNLGVLTASTDVIRQFVADEIDEGAFSEQLHGDVDLEPPSRR